MNRTTNHAFVNASHAFSADSRWGGRRNRLPNSRWPRPDNTDEDWPLWLTALATGLFCAAVWAGIIYLILSL